MAGEQIKVIYISHEVSDRYLGYETPLFHSTFRYTVTTHLVINSTIHLDIQLSTQPFIQSSIHPHIKL